MLVKQINRFLTTGIYHNILMMMNKDDAVKVAIVGDCGVGKTCLIQRFKTKSFNSSTSSTMGFDFCKVNFLYDGKEKEVQLWDTAGQERYRALCEQYLRSSDGIVLVYDVTKADSFSNIGDWLTTIKKNENMLNYNFVMLLGNKCDLDHIRQCEKDDGEKLVGEYENVLMFFETSAKSGKDVDKAFTSFFQKICDVKSKEIEEKKDKERKSVVVLETNEKKDSCSCVS